MMGIVQELVSYFIIYSFFGWILESIYKTYLQKKIVNSGFLYGPFCPIYGIGAIIMLLFLDRFKGNTAILFVISTVVLSIWEYIVGWALEKIFNIKYWDYSEHRWNLNGRICLGHSILWGVLGILFINIIHPIIKDAYLCVPTYLMRYAVLLVITYILIDLVISIIKVKNINIKLKNLKEVTKAIKDKTEEMKQVLEDSQATKKLKQTVEELREKQQELKEKIEIQTKRLKRAFPTMHLKGVTEAINKRIKVFKGEK